MVRMQNTTNRRESILKIIYFRKPLTYVLHQTGETPWPSLRASPFTAD
jgi:hypothetical protein